MTLFDVHNIVKYYVNKNQGSYLPPADIDALLDVGQLSLYNDYHLKKGTSEHIDTALMAFKTIYTFTNATSVNGVVRLPDTFFNLLDVYTIIVDADNVVRHRPCPLVNEDERINRVNSQVVPLSTTNPFTEMGGKAELQLWPKVPQAGVVTFYRRPRVPFLGYTLISGRVLVYNPNTTIQLEWSDKDINAIIILALNSIGINLSEADIIQWSQDKIIQNVTSPIKN